MNDFSQVLTNLECYLECLRQDSACNRIPMREGRISEIGRSHVPLAQHELAEDKLYLIWRNGRLVIPELYALWNESLARLTEKMGPEYFGWVIQNHSC